LERARAHLRRADPVLRRLIDREPTFDPRIELDELSQMDIFGVALLQVTGQQLSVASTRRTIGRIKLLFDGHLPTPSELLGVEAIQLRAAGLSRRRVETLRDLAARLTDGRLETDALALLSDDGFVSALTAIPGIGPWTAQGVLLVALQREDVALPGDLALRKAIRDAYELDGLPSEQEVVAIAQKWRPFRSLAASYLFASAFDRDDAGR
jgi:DNA-3-methyladenine glycosylase II